MRNVITKEIVKIDKTLREQIEILELEKAHIDLAVKKEKERIIKDFNRQLSKLIEQTKQEQEALFESIEREARIAFDTRLKQLHTQYQEQKDAWIEHIFDSIKNT